MVQYLGLMVEGAPFIVVLELLLLPCCFTHLQKKTLINESINQGPLIG